MKRVIFAAVAACGILVGTSYKAEAQVEQGSFMIDPYVGAPTWNVWWGNVIDFNAVDNYSTTGAPISYGARFEYMVADNFGIGLDGNYAGAGFQYDDINTDDTLNTIQSLKFRSDRIRVMLRLNYHFVQTENLDVYLGFGAGYRNVTRTVWWDDVQDDNSTLDFATGNSQPIAVRLALGGRYYFHPNIGLNFEMGISGGGIIQAGLAIKI